MGDTLIKVGGEVRASTTQYNYMFNSCVVPLADGGHVVLWEASIPGYVPGYFFQMYVSDVLAQRFDAAGNPVGGEFFVNQDLRYGCSLGGAMATPDGGFRAVYYSWAPDVSIDQSEIVVTRFAADGTRVGSETVLNLDTAYQQERPQIAECDGGGFVVVWQSREPGDYTPWNVRAQAFDANGLRIGTEITVSQTLANYQEMPRVTGLQGGGFVVVWNTYGYDADGEGNGQAAMARIFAADGSPVSDEFVVNTTVAGIQQDPDVTALAGGGFVAVWESQNAEPAPGWGYGVVAQVFDAAGLRVGGEIVVNTQMAADQRDPVVAAAPDGGFVVAWWNQADYGVHVQRFAADGTRAGDELRADTFDDAYLDYFNYSAAVSFLDDGTMVVAWARASGGSNGAYAIFSQRFAAQTFGTAADDALTGGRLADWIGGLDGTDSLAGGTGDDTLSGGAGNDSLDGGRGADALDGGADDDALSGGTGAAADTLTGGAGNDTLDGGRGADVLAGGDGDDVYDLDHAGDSVAEATGGGTDTVRGAVNLNLSNLGGEVENAELTGNAARSVTGNDLANRLVGNAGANTLRGGLGDDTLLGGADNDRLDGETGNDSLSGEIGADTLDGGTGDDLLQGGNGDDVLIGGAGSDTVDGGAGNDVLTGGAAADVFVFASGFGTDTVADFAVAVPGERIDLRGVTAIAGFDDLLANHLVSNSAGDAVIVAGPNSITLTGVAAGALTEGDFLF
jgi:Ca2+-binding RTX toxin-like protein